MRLWRMMATPSVRRAAAAVGWLLLLLAWSARAAEPHAVPKETARGVGTAKLAPRRGSVPARAGDAGGRRAGGPPAGDSAPGPPSPPPRAPRGAGPALFSLGAPAAGERCPSDSSSALPP